MLSAQVPATAEKQSKKQTPAPNARPPGDKAPQQKTRNVLAAVSPTCQRLKNLVAKRFFPKINSEGQIYLTPHAMKGTQAKQKRLTFTTNVGVDKHVEQFFPNFPIYKLPNPKFEALAIKGQGHWTAKSVADAASLFHMPEQTEVVVVFPDLFDGELFHKEFGQTCRCEGKNFFQVQFLDS